MYFKFQNGIMKVVRNWLSSSSRYPFEGINFCEDLGPFFCYGLGRRD